jgi:hypothetical protein
MGPFVLCKIPNALAVVGTFVTPASSTKPEENIPFFLLLEMAQITFSVNTHLFKHLEEINTYILLSPQYLMFKRFFILC